MAKRKLFYRIYPTYLLVVVLSLMAVIWYSATSAKTFYRGRIKEDLEVRAKLLQVPLFRLIQSKEFAKVNEVCRSLGHQTSTRITIIDTKGVVVADSDETASEMENHATPSRPEILTAYEGRIGDSIRYSDTLEREMMYVAVPIHIEGKVAYVLRTSVSLESIDQALTQIYRKLAAGGIVVAILIAGISLLISRKISGPIEKIRAGAQRIASGELDQRLPSSDTEELSDLSETLNHMSGQLRQRLLEITQERNERDAILESMREGVIAVDMKAHIISANHAASDLLGIDYKAEGRLLHEVVRNAGLQEFSEKLLADKKPMQNEFIFYNHDEHYLQAYGSLLYDAEDQVIGAVIVLNDITQVRRLENLRRDFVANVSHEIKTPLTAIKGSVETLEGGAMSDPNDAERFMKIITKHTERLNALVEDILSLSSLERGVDKNEFNFADANMKEVVETAIDLCREKAESRNIEINMECPDDLTAELDRQLFEQGLVNLIDNAVKYSGEGTQVDVKATKNNNQIRIAVRDYGCGIPREHIPRLFERFYRVDKARSRRLGGTGLGLAIVKHIVQTHSGTVDVDSSPGQGSTFTVILPL